MTEHRGLNVHSEIGKLESVVIHRPGRDLINFRVEDFEQVWSHDAFYLARAQEEHDQFADLLRAEGTEVLYIEDLVVEALDAAPQARSEFTDQLMGESLIKSPALVKAVREKLDSISDTSEFVETVMSGLHYQDIDLTSVSRGSLEDMESETPDPAAPVLIPMPGLQFPRDPIAVVGKGVLLNHMYKPQRNREVILYETVFKHHPAYREVPVWYAHDAAKHIEGGDILNIDAHTLAVGISQRTEVGAIDLLAHNLFWGSEKSEIDTIYAIGIPVGYAYMHLDTVFTQVDYDKFTVYPGIYDTLRVYRIVRGERDGTLDIRQINGSLEDILSEATGQRRVRLIECGGGDPIEASREQWNDGSNTLAVAPGVVCVYERNAVTNAVLRKEGLRLLVVPSAELSRGRGGPRCMSMPFWREEI